MTTKFDKAAPLMSVDFEVFGKVQRVFFRKYTQAHGKGLGLRGWCMNTAKGTVIGQVQGTPDKVDVMKRWLLTKGSPKSTIERVEFRNEKKIDHYSYHDFDIKK